MPRIAGQLSGAAGAQFCSLLNQSLLGWAQGRCIVDSPPAIPNPCPIQDQSQKGICGSPEQKMLDALIIAPFGVVCPEQGSKRRSKKIISWPPEWVRKPNLLTPYGNPTHGPPSIVTCLYRPPPALGSPMPPGQKGCIAHRATPSLQFPPWSEICLLKTPLQSVQRWSSRPSQCVGTAL